MGKVKQAQRTKNNARPSNSSRSAEFLVSTAHNLMGFSALKDTGLASSSTIIKDGGSLRNLNTSKISEVDMTNIDSKFQVVFKKMSKKDCTTKCKALQEFIELCQESELSSIENLLAFWSRLYTQLTNDLERKVREYAQIAHRALVKRVGKNIAIYLKQLSGPWFVSQFDTYPPSASAASNSFNETFPANKITNAIIHCQDDILNYISDNILGGQVTQFQSKKSSLIAEEIESNNQRILTSSLQAYSFYLKSVPSAEIEKTDAIHQRILGKNSKFWKCSNHDSVAIKTAFFNVLTSVLQNANHLLENEKKRVLTSVINGLDETDPGLVSAVWETLLIAIDKIEDWFKVISIEKFLLPKLWRILRNGSQYCPTILYPNLLPFLGQFSKFNIDREKFFLDFFDNMREGFLMKNSRLTQSEISAIIGSFVECLQYSILKNFSDKEICSRLLKDELIIMIEYSLKENSSHNKIFFTQVSQLIRHWTRQCNESEIYCDIINLFWQELEIIFDKLINNHEDLDFDDEEVSTFNSQIDLLLLFKNSSVSRSGKKVKFSDESDIEIKNEDLVSEEDNLFLARLECFIHTLCINYFRRFSIKPKKRIQQLVKLISSFESKELFLAIAKNLNGDSNLISIYDILKTWLEDEVEESQAIIQLIFMLLKHMNKLDQEYVLDSLLKLKDSFILKNALLNALSGQNRNINTIKSWCNNFDVGLVLNEVTESIIKLDSKDVETNKRMILLAFEATDEGVPLISSEAIYNVISTLCSSMDKRNSLFIGNIVSQILELTSAYKNLEDPQIISAVCFILEKLFKFNMECELKDETICKIWKRNLSRVYKLTSQSRFIQLIKNLASIFWERIAGDNSDNENIFEVDSAIEVATDFLESIIEGDGYCVSRENEEIVSFFLMEMNLKEWIANFSGISLYAEFITGNIYRPNLKKIEEIRIWNDVLHLNLEDNFIDYSVNSLKWTLLTTRIINKSLNKVRRIEENGSKSIEKYSRSLESLTLMNSLGIIFNLIYIFTLGKIYQKHYKSSKHHMFINRLLDEISEEFRNLKEFITDDIRDKIDDFLSENITNNVLPHLLHFYHTLFQPDVTPSMYFKNYENIYLIEDRNKRIVYIRGIQILPQYFDEEKLIGYLNANELSTEESLIIAISKFLNTRENFKLIEILDKIINSDNGNPCSILYNNTISDAKLNSISLIIQILHSFTELINSYPEKLTSLHWDFIMTSMVELEFSIFSTIMSLESKNFTENHENKNYPSDISVLVIAVSRLFTAVQTLMNNQQRESIIELPPELIEEWKEVFQSHAHLGMAQIWINSSKIISEINKKTSSSSSSSSTTLIIIDTLGSSVKLIDAEIFSLNQEIDSRIDLVTPNQVIQSSLNLLTSSIPNLQLGSYYMLNLVIPRFIEKDKASIQNNYDLEFVKLVQFNNVLSSIENIVNTMLMDFKACDIISCTIQPHTDSYTYTLGYLLFWSVLLKMCASARGDLRYQYAETLKDNHFPCLMETIFKLMPIELLQDSSKVKSSRLFELFSSRPSLEFNESWTEWKLDHIACWLYADCLRYLPVLVRQWWSTTDSRVSSAIDKITLIYVSPMLCQEELQSSKFVNIENMQVKVLPSAREVIALYQMDDTKLELSIVLPANHPLGAVTITPCQYVGGTSNWRNCHMQLSILLTHQNGSLLDGLMLWKSNLDKKFAGIEECYICFSVFHLGTYQIPKSSCPTCKKKFHTSCLYKWFNTSQKSSCPICRNVF